VAAFIEWPVMSIVASKVKSIGWEKMIMIAYIMSGINLGLVPFVLLLNGTIWYGYAIQIITGLVFGLRQPTTTFGIYNSLENNQKSLGQSFFQTISLIGAFLGHLIGALISFITPNGISVFYGIYWFASIIAIGSAFIFYLIKPKLNQ
jgi:MFS family permease